MIPDPLRHTSGHPQRREDSEGREQLRHDSSNPSTNREHEDEDREDPVHPGPPRGELQRF